jgi:glycosyltransferase involved in cell wall biosynthesis
MKVLIITRSFVREVSYLVRYAVRSALPLEFAVVMPYHDHSETPLPAHVSIRKLYFARRMRATCYAPSLFHDIQGFRPDILHIFEEFSGLIALQSLLFRNLSGQKSKVMVYSAENLRKNLRTMFRFSGKYVANRSDLAFVCSHGVKDVLEAEGYSKPIEVFPLGVDTKNFYQFSVDRLKTQLNLDGKFVIGYVGRLIEIKGVHLLIEMMHDLPEQVHLLLIGSGPEERPLQTTVSKYHLEHQVHFLGDVPYQQLPQYINCMDIGIVPSKTTKRWKEQFGRVIVEFMSCEVPVIGSDSGSIPEVLGDAGWIFHENNLQELTYSVQFLMEYPKRREELGKLGRERATAHYSLEIMCEQFLAMYEKLLMKKL